MNRRWLSLYLFAIISSGFISLSGKAETFSGAEPLQLSAAMIKWKTPVWAFGTLWLNTVSQEAGWWISDANTGRFEVEELEPDQNQEKKYRLKYGNGQLIVSVYLSGCVTEWYRKETDGKRNVLVVNTFDTPLIHYAYTLRNEPILKWKTPDWALGWLSLDLNHNKAYWRVSESEQGDFDVIRLSNSEFELRDSIGRVSLRIIPSHISPSVEGIRYHGSKEAYRFSGILEAGLLEIIN